MLVRSSRMAPEGVKCYNPAFDVTDHTPHRRHHHGEGHLPGPLHREPRRPF